MAHLFKPVSVKPIPKTATIRTIDGARCACWTARGGRKVTAPLTDDSRRCRVESPTWWVEYTGHDGRRSRTRGFRDRGATLQLAASLESKARAVRGGYEAPPERDRDGPRELADHAEDFRQHLEDLGRTPPHVHNVLRYVTDTVRGCRLTLPAAVDPEAVGRWLANERRRLDWSPQNLNRWVLHLRQFGRWLARTGRCRWNPFESLTGADARASKTRNRRRIEQDHLALLIDATRRSKVVRERLDGPARAALYTVAAYTGLRRGSLRSLTPESFQWDAGRPVAVTVAPRAWKGRKAHTVPIHPEVAAALARWLRGRTPGAKLWDGAYKSAEMLRGDLGDAREAWVAAAKGKAERKRRGTSDVLSYKDHAGEQFDFHALRVQFVSSLALAGVPLTAAQKLAGHSTPTLTANVYGRWGKELAGEVAKMPGLTQTKRRTKGVG